MKINLKIFRQGLFMLDAIEVFRHFKIKNEVVFAVNLYLQNKKDIELLGESILISDCIENIIAKETKLKNTFSYVISQQK